MKNFISYINKNQLEIIVYSSIAITIFCTILFIIDSQSRGFLL